MRSLLNESSWSIRSRLEKEGSIATPFFRNGDSRFEVKVDGVYKDGIRRVSNLYLIKPYLISSRVKEVNSPLAKDCFQDCKKVGKPSSSCIKRGACTLQSHLHNLGIVSLPPNESNFSVYDVTQETSDGITVTVFTSSDGNVKRIAKNKEELVSILKGLKDEDENTALEGEYASSIVFDRFDIVSVARFMRVLGLRSYLFPTLLKSYDPSLNHFSNSISSLSQFFSSSPKDNEEPFQVVLELWVKWKSEYERKNVPYGSKGETLASSFMTVLVLNVKNCVEVENVSTPTNMRKNEVLIRTVPSFYNEESLLKVSKNDMRESTVSSSEMKELYVRGPLVEGVSLLSMKKKEDNKKRDGESTPFLLKNIWNMMSHPESLPSSRGWTLKGEIWNEFVPDPNVNTDVLDPRG